MTSRLTTGRGDTTDVHYFEERAVSLSEIERGFPTTDSTFDSGSTDQSPVETATRSRHESTASQTSRDGNATPIADLSLDESTPASRDEEFDWQQWTRTNLEELHARAPAERVSGEECLRVLARPCVPVDRAIDNDDDKIPASNAFGNEDRRTPLWKTRLTNPTEEEERAWYESAQERNTDAQAENSRILIRRY